MSINAKASDRGKNWFNEFTKDFQKRNQYIESVLVADGLLYTLPIRVIAVVPDENNLFPRARSGEVGLLEGWTLAKAVDDVIQADMDKEKKSIILSIVDVPSQAYGRREELFGIHQALAGAVDSYARARLAKHPVISLLVGKSMSGAFLAHGYQANRIFALNDDGVMVHAMGKESAARVTLRTVEDLEKLAASIPPMAYDIKNFSTLGLLTECINVEKAEYPTKNDLSNIKHRLALAVTDIQQQNSSGLEQRLGGENRKMSKTVRELLREQW